MLLLLLTTLTSEKYLVYSDGIPAMYSQELVAGDLIDLVIQNGSFFSIYETTAPMSVRKFASIDEKKNMMFEYSGNSEVLAHIDRVEVPPAILTFEALSPTSFGIAYGSISHFKCNNLIIENSDLLQFHSKETRRISSKLCFFYGAKGLQSVTGTYGRCSDCPTLEIYAGYDLLSKIVSMNTEFNNVSPNPKVPLILAITPPDNKTVDISHIKFNMTTNESSKASRSYQIYDSVKRYDTFEPEIHDLQIGQILVYSAFGLFGASSLVLITLYIVIRCKERKAKLINDSLYPKSQGIIRTLQLYTNN